MATSQRLDVRMSLTLYHWISKRAKKLGFSSTAAYVRHVFERLRLEEIGGSKS